MTRKKGTEEAPITQQENDFGTPELRRQAFHVVEQPDPQDRATRRVRVETDMVSWYLRREYIKPKQADALRKWESDAYLAGILAPIIGNYQQAVSGGHEVISDLRMSAQGRRDNAIRCVEQLDRDAVNLLDAVAVHSMGAGPYMKRLNGTYPHDALLLLCKLSDALVRHYGL